MRIEEKYALDLCDFVLGCKSLRQHRFDFLRGDPGKRRFGTKLPVDAYYESLKLVIEYCERQHYEPVPFFDKPDKITVSGVSRGDQRRMYDQRRRDVLPEHGIVFVELDYQTLNRDKGNKLVYDRNHDEKVIRNLLRKHFKSVNAK